MANEIQTNATDIVERVDRKAFTDRRGRQVVAPEGSQIVVQKETGQKFLSIPLMEHDSRGRAIKLQAPTGIASIDTASTQFMALFQAGFGQQLQGVADTIAQRETVDGKFLGIPVGLTKPRARQWTGAKQMQNGRTAYYTGEIVKYEMSTEINRIDVDYDKSGVVNSWIDTFMANAVFADDDLLLTAFNANTWTGFDAVALLSASHVYATNTNNLSTSAFTAAVYKTARALLLSFTDENGTPWNVGALNLMLLHGPNLERTVLEVLTAEGRSQAVDSSGAYDTTASVVGAAPLQNVFRNTASPLMTPWFAGIGSGNQWALINATAGYKPMVIAEARPWTPIMQIAMDGEARFMTDQYRFSLEKDAAYMAGFWPSIVASVT